MGDLESEEDKPLLAKSQNGKLYSRDNARCQSVQTVEGDIGTLEATTTSASTENDDDESNEEEASFSISNLSRRSKYSLVMMALATLLSGCGFSIIAPFFPAEAAKKGVSTTVVGLIFSVIEFVQFVSSPILGTYMTAIGPKFMFMSGFFVGGSCTILFGFLDQCPPGNTFILVCFLCRIVQALGLSGYYTAGFAIISNEFPNHVATVYGVLETATGIGFMIGPAIGGALYELGGYGLPFFVLGGAILLNGAVIYKFLPSPENIEQTRTKSVFSLLKSPMILVSGLATASGAIGMAFLDPTLSSHLEKFSLTPGLVGLMFVVYAALYGVTSPLWGYLSDSKDIQSPLLILGSLVCGVSFLLLGPCPLLPFIPFSLWTITAGLAVYGLSLGCVVVPTFACMVIGAQDMGFEDNIDTYGIVSGLYNSIYCFGAFLGPIVGGFLVDHFSFGWASTAISGIYAFSMVVSIIYFGFRKLTNKSSQDSWKHRRQSLTIKPEEVETVFATTSRKKRSRTQSIHSSPHWISSGNTRCLQSI